MVGWKRRAKKTISTTIMTIQTRSKWMAMASSILIQCTSGSSYAFGIYSPLLKSSQSYDQSTLDSIAVFKDVGANAGLLSGLLYTSKGPAPVHAAGAIQCFLGYSLIWLSVVGLLPRPPVPLMCLYMFVAAHAQTFFNTGNVVTAVLNFPDYSGTVVGIMKGFLGLSGAILIQVYDNVLKGKPSSFLLMLALLPTLDPLLLMFFVRTYPPHEGHDIKKHLNCFSVVALVIAAYIMFLIILKNVVSLGMLARIITFVILLLALASLVVIAIRAHLMDSRLPSSSIEGTGLLEDAGSVGSEKALARYERTAHQDDAQELSILDKTAMLRGGDLNLLQAICTVDFWLLFLAMSCGMGSGLATVNNISQIGESLGYTTMETSTLVSLYSIWNFLGRFGAGYISDYFLHLRGLARPIFMVITLATMSIGHLVIASGLQGALYAGPILVGVCYGSQWSLMPTVTSEIFGVRHMGTIFNTIAIASPVGSYILSVRVVGYIYDKESASGHGCVGNHCFMLSFVIMACVSLLGSCIALGLFFRTRRFYKQVIFERLRHSMRE
ncbi:hypothetical protein Scep_017576 [Stephania cephalantha]|uniref:Nodulin-like domain-containing protein n=1 Tax=Stephania cephalantha TaxID=152367 RepID=A0AAP0NUC8_9MAGN